MSEYCVINVDMKNKEALKESLKELGYPFEDHEEAKQLQGYKGDLRSQKAHIIVRKEYVGAASNDIGFLRGADGKYKLIISRYDKSWMRAKNDFTQKLKQLYSKHTTLQKARKLGYTATKTTIDEKGRMRIRLKSHV